MIDNLENISVGDAQKGVQNISIFGNNTMLMYWFQTFSDKIKRYLPKLFPY